jgi:hypothetical protein
VQSEPRTTTKEAAMRFDENTPDAELGPRFQAELLELYTSGKTITIELDAIEAFHVFASLQLALRHPRHSGPSAGAVTDIAGEIERELCTDEQPAMKEVARRGWNRRHDARV